METHLVLCLRLLLAAILGGAVGLERELAGKPAGLRTNLLIAMGAALFTHVSLAIPAVTGSGDPARVAAQVVAGVGFLGAGTIIHARHAVHGLTSAATVWVVAGLGVAVGAGTEHDAVLAALVVLVGLTAFRAVEHRFLGRESLSLTLAFTGEPSDAAALVGGPSRHLLWIVLGVVAVAALSAVPWALRSRTAVQGAQSAPVDDLRQRTAELIGYSSSIRLTPDQEKVKADALSAIPAPCGNRNSLAVRCCGCNLFKSIGGLANHMIAREGADAGRVRQAVLDWIGRTNPGGYSGAACDSKRCERPFREDGCGGMSEARLVS